MLLIKLSFNTRKIPLNNKKKAIITFDDGYESIFLNAAPILRKYGIKAIIFVNMAPINKELFAWAYII